MIKSAPLIVLAALRTEVLEKSRSTPGLSNASANTCSCDNFGVFSVYLEDARVYGVLWERGDGSGTAPSGIGRYRWGLGEWK